MDRSDERKEHHEGNILNISEVTPSHEEITTPVFPAKTDDEKRRERMERGADEVLTSTQEENAMHRGKGVTGADLGSAGESTGLDE